jgi:hypothetical protein
MVKTDGEASRFSHTNIKSLLRLAEIRISAPRSRWFDGGAAGRERPPYPVTTRPQAGIFGFRGTSLIITL